MASNPVCRRAARATVMRRKASASESAQRPRAINEHRREGRARTVDARRPRQCARTTSASTRRAWWTSASSRRSSSSSGTSRRARVASKAGVDSMGSKIGNRLRASLEAERRQQQTTFEFSRESRCDCAVAWSRAISRTGPGSRSRPAIRVSTQKLSRAARKKLASILGTKLVLDSSWKCEQARPRLAVAPTPRPASARPTADASDSLKGGDSRGHDGPLRS